MTQEPTPPAPAPRVPRQREPGGTFPGIVDLWRESLDDVVENAMGYLQVGLALFAVSLPVGMIVGVFGTLLVYALMFGGILASFAGGAAIGQAAGDKDLAAMIGAFGSVGSIACSLLSLFGMIALMVAALGPFSASLTRTIAAHQRGDGELTFQAAFATIRQDMVSSAAVIGLVTMASFVGLLFCYVGALVPAMLFSFAPAMVALHRTSARTALSRAARAAMADPTSHLAYAAAFTFTSMIAAYIPVMGYAFILALGVRAFRKLHGDEPAHGTE